MNLEWKGDVGAGYGLCAVSSLAGCGYRIIVNDEVFCAHSRYTDESGTMWDDKNLGWARCQDLEDYYSR